MKLIQGRQLYGRLPQMLREPTIETLLRVGVPHVVRNGSASDLMLRNISSSSNMNVVMGAVGLISPSDTFRYLSTDSLITCFGIAVHCPIKRTVLLAHAQNPLVANFALQMALDSGLTNVTIYGGDQKYPESRETLSVINGFLAHYSNDFKVMGRNTEGFQERSRLIAADKESGELFIPKIH